MAIIDDASEDVNIQELCERTRVPELFAKNEIGLATEAMDKRSRWASEAVGHLKQLKDLARRHDLSIAQRACIAFTAACFDGDGDWIVEESARSSTELLEYTKAYEHPVMRAVLSDHLRPIFRINPHPSLSTETGRKLPHPAGGPMGTQDHFIEQAWKTHPALSNVLFWCVKSAKDADYENIWHLLVPPVMTLLDDYEATYKLRGLNIVAEMLKRVPASLLSRTGLDGLLSSSLTTCLTYLHNPETPDLIRATVPVHIKLIDLTTSSGSSHRFDRLCSVLSDGIIGSVWFYASRDPLAIQTSMEVLPELLRALGIGSARFLKALVPQLVHPLLPQIGSDDIQIRNLRLAALSAIQVLVEDCAVRIHRWRTDIVEGVVKCWVGLSDSGVDDGELKHALRSVCSGLVKASPSIVEECFMPLTKVEPCLSELFSGTNTFAA